MSLPSIDAILGDKMTTIAPRTIGISLNNDRTLEIGKQFFDLGILFDAMNNIEIVKRSFEMTCKKEISYQLKKQITIDAVLSDLFEMCLTLAFQGKRNPDDYQIMVPGISKVHNYLFSQDRFNLPEILKASTKVAYLSQFFDSRADQSIQKYSPDIDVQGLLIEDVQFNRINKIKKQTHEGFYYWYEALKLGNIS